MNPRDREPTAQTQTAQSTSVTGTASAAAADGPIRSVKEFIKRYFPSAEECPHCHGTGMKRGSNTTLDRARLRRELLTPAPAIVETQEPRTGVRGQVVEGDVIP